MKSKLTQSLSLLTLCILIITACNYYKVITLKNESETATYSSLDSLQKLKRHFILRTGTRSFYIKDLKLNADNKSASCVLDTLPADHLFYLTQPKNSNRRYKPSISTQSAIINEIHFYSADKTSVATGPYTLDLSQIQKIEVIQHDKKRTTNSYVIGTIATVAGAALVTSILILALKSSCPFVSAYNGNDFTLQGEIYGGAIYPQLSRKDYLMLNMANKEDGTLQVKISNELKEKQYTDLVKLWIIDHPKNTKVVVDEKGKLHSIAQPHQPIKATLNHKDVLSYVSKSGDNKLLYMDDSSGKDAINEITLRFKRPLHTKQAKLLLRLKNTYFLDLLYGELAMNMGTYYSSFVAKQKNKTAGELKKWVTAQNIPLTVSVGSESGWIKQNTLTTVGPLEFRESVIELDLTNSTTEEVAIKLSSGFMFWEIDYAAIDYSSNDMMTVEVLSPESAIDELNRNVRTAIATEDNIYLEQPQIGNVTTISFRNSNLPKKNMERSYVLEAKGYYEHIRDFKNKPDFAFLRQFKRDGTFPAYGLRLYKKAKQHSANSFASLH
ncbi:hypothetical protein WG954_17540 [Lacibacter sp. H375]|uniref:hypothetical protein n=1 Tax=Lacibacter sp. H375 TaxID=3133424 RepID=UPI0030BFD2CC